MCTRSILVSLAILTLQIMPACATPCDKVGSEELAARSAKLPSFIVARSGESFDGAIARALNCTLPPPPTFAGGERVDLKKVVGQHVFTEDGKFIGSVAGLAVAPNTAKTKSLVKMDFGAGTASAAIPFESLIVGKKAGFIVQDVGNLDLEKKWPVGSNTERIGEDAVFASVCFMCPFQNLIPIDFTSDPPGGTTFVGEEKWGNTEIKGSVKQSEMEKIRIEYPKRKPCKFADGNYKSSDATGLGYATFFCKLQPADH